MSDELTLGADEVGGAGGVLSPQEIIRLEIDGMGSAVARYDAIIWKIRSGYVVVIYGAITLASKWLTSDGGGGPGALLPVIVLGFSLAGLAVDATFQRSKFRVIASRNELISTAWKLSRANWARALVEESATRIGKLLEMSGEQQDPATHQRVKDYLRSRDTLGVYAALYAAPVVVAIGVAIAV
jgi:hypothetical protein